jgi:hypothetical protein
MSETVRGIPFPVERLPALANKRGVEPRCSTPLDGQSSLSVHAKQPVFFEAGKKVIAAKAVAGGERLH